MQVLNIFCAGAAQSVVAELAAALEKEGSHVIAAQYGAVHALKARIVAGDPADFVILTDRLIDELIDSGLVVPGSRADLGPVPTGVAVRRDEPAPDIGSTDQLREALLNAERIVCPDPAVASAGRALLDALARLGILDAVRPRLLYCPSGYAAVERLAAASEAGELGVMQLTEILAHQTVALAGTLPLELQPAVAVYAAGLGANSKHAADSAAFIRRLAGSSEALKAAGFGAP